MHIIMGRIIVLVLLSLLIICQLSIIKVNAQFTYFSSYCTDTGTNYTSNSPYENNLNRLFDKLTSKSSSSRFDNYTVGDNASPNKVYGLFQCRFDVSLTICNTCIKNATEKIVEDCPTYGEAAVWYYECMLRYANRYIFSVYDDDTYGSSLCSPGNVSNYAEFAPILAKSMNDVIENASSTSRRYASDEANLTLFNRLYSFAQCTPDIDSFGCEKCLRWTLRFVTNNCNGSEWAMVFYNSCQLRYDSTLIFLNEIDPSSPAPAPPPDDSNNESDGTPPSPPSTISTPVIAAIAAGVSVGLLALIVVVWICIRRKRQGNENNNVAPVTPLSPRQQSHGTESSIRDPGDNEGVQYDFATLRIATGDFSVGNRLGEGGFGIVYKGTLENGETIAIKRLSNKSSQGTKEFMAEARLLAKLQHRSLVRLRGFCSEGDEKLLVYEFMPNSSLDRFLFEDPQKRRQLNWERRSEIIMGIAKGLQYLHEDSSFTIIHRDLKPENILLDKEMNPKIADFGLARLFEQTQNLGNTIRIAGTPGYIAPECMSGEYSKKTDVYSFGVVLLEIMSGQSNRIVYQNSQGEDLPIQAWRLWKERRPLDLTDPELRIHYLSDDVVVRYIQIGLLCLQENAELRPTITKVVLMLTVASINIPLPSPPAMSFPQYGSRGARA